MSAISDYLQIMGIPVWRLRTGVPAKPITPTPCYYYEFYNDTQKQPICLLFADAKLAEDSISAEKQLVNAIAKSIQKKFSEKLSDDAVTEIKSGALIHTRVIILLGERVSTVIRSLIGQCPVVVSYSPAEILANEKLKANVWKEIKTAIKIIETPTCASAY